MNKEIIIGRLKEEYLYNKLEKILKALSPELKDDEEIWALAVTRNYHTLIISPFKDNEKFCQPVVKTHPQAINYVSYRLQHDSKFLSICEKILKLNDHLYKKMDPLKEHFLKRLREKKCTCDRICGEEYHCCMKQLLDNLPDHLLYDTDIWELVIKIDVDAFKFVSKDMKENKNFCSHVAKHGISMLAHVPYKLRNDIHFMLPLIRINSSALRYISDELRDDESLFKYLLVEDPSLFRYVSDRLKDNDDLVKLAIIKDPRNMLYISDRLRKNVDLMRTVAKECPLARSYMMEYIRLKL